MEIGVDSFVAGVPDPRTGEVPDAADRMARLLEEVEAADRAGLDSFGVGEHHRPEFLDAAPAVILAAAAARTKTIRLASAVTVLSAADPVRVFQEFATIDLISRGRVDLVVGRGSFGEAFPLFGMDPAQYDSLFSEKLQLLLKLREQSHITWSGRHRPPLTGQGVYPRPMQRPLPVWVGVGGTPASFARAGTLGLPLMVAIIGGTPEHFRPLVDLYRQAGHNAGYPPQQLRVGVHAFGYVADTDAQAADEFFPGYAADMTRIGRERNWPPMTRARFDALLRPGGALAIGSPELVAAKVIEYHTALGGIDRFNFQMSIARLPHERMLRAIELIGAKVAPIVRRSAGATNTQPG
jgi:probable LLM family oxidoreductase